MTAESFDWEKWRKEEIELSRTIEEDLKLLKESALSSPETFEIVKKPTLDRLRKYGELCSVNPMSVREMGEDIERRLSGYADVLENGLEDFYKALIFRDQKEIPRINFDPKWSDGREQYRKIIQVYVDDQPFLRFDTIPFPICDSSSHSLHARILRKLLIDLGLDYQTRAVLSSGQIIPKPSGSRYGIVGAGVADLSPNYGHPGTKIPFFGESSHYHVGINQEHLDKLKQFWPDGLEVGVGDY